MKARLPQGMGGGPQNMQNMLRQAQKMQENLENKKAELEEKEYVVTSGGGMVTTQLRQSALTLRLLTLRM